MSNIIDFQQYKLRKAKAESWAKMKDAILNHPFDNGLDILNVRTKPFIKSKFVVDSFPQNKTSLWMDDYLRYLPTKPDSDTV